MRIAVAKESLSMHGEVCAVHAVSAPARHVFLGGVGGVWG